MSKVSVRQAAKLAGKSRETINNATKTGALSYTLNARSHKVIDIAELERVYPLVRTPEDLEQSESVQLTDKMPVSGPVSLEQEVAVLRERIELQQKASELLQSERDRERRQLEDDIKHLREVLAKTQDQHSKAMLLITDQRKQDDSHQARSEEQIEALELTVRKMKRYIIKERKAKQEQGFWQRLLTR